MSLFERKKFERSKANERLEDGLVEEFSIFSNRMVKSVLRDQKIVNEYNRASLMSYILSDELYDMEIEIHKNAKYSNWFKAWVDICEPKIFKISFVVWVAFQIVFALTIALVSYIVLPGVISFIDSILNFLFVYDPETSSMFVIVVFFGLKLFMFSSITYFSMVFLFRFVWSRIERTITVAMLNTAFKASNVTGTMDELSDFKTKIKVREEIMRDLSDTVEYKNKLTKKYLKAKTSLGLDK